MWIIITIKKKMLLVSLQMVKHTGDFGLCILNSGLCILSRSERCTLTVLLFCFFLEMKEAWMLLCVRVCGWEGHMHAAVLRACLGFIFVLNCIDTTSRFRPREPGGPSSSAQEWQHYFFGLKVPHYARFWLVFFIWLFSKPRLRWSMICTLYCPKKLLIYPKKTSIFSPAFATSS